MHNLDFMLQTLVNLALHYPQAGRTPAQLRVLAEDWAEDLAAFPRDIVERAVKAHRRESPYFPTVADIWRRCGELRRGLEARREAERALPGRTLTRDEQIALKTGMLRTCGVTRLCAGLSGRASARRRGGGGPWDAGAAGCGARRGMARAPGVPEPCGTGKRNTETKRSRDGRALGELCGTG